MKNRKVKYTLIVILAVVILYTLQYNLNKAITFNHSFTLANHKYALNEGESSVFYYIKQDKYLMSFKEVKYDHNDNVSITAKDNGEFIISLFATEDAVVCWTCKYNEGESKIVKLKETYYIYPFALSNLSSRKGYGIRRQNFVFKSLGAGEEKITFDNGYNKFTIDLTTK